MAQLSEGSLGGILVNVAEPCPQWFGVTIAWGFWEIHLPKAF